MNRDKSLSISRVEGNQKLNDNIVYSLHETFRFKYTSDSLTTAANFATVVDGLSKVSFPFPRQDTLLFRSA